MQTHSFLILQQKVKTKKLCDKASNHFCFRHRAKLSTDDKISALPQVIPREAVSHLLVKKFDVETNNVADGLSLRRDVIYQELAHRGHH